MTQNYDALLCVNLLRNFYDPLLKTPPMADFKLELTTAAENLSSKAIDENKIILEKLLTLLMFDCLRDILLLLLL